MGKRSREQANGSDVAERRPRKAPKQEDTANVVPITSSRELRTVLKFHQDDENAQKEAQSSFKAFLDSVIAEDGNPLSGALAILKEYLDSQPTDLFQAWTFASQTDNERLFTAVTSNIALLLKTLSSQLELREHGLAVAKQILGREYLRLLFRGLTAESHKEALISPCLRVLTEVVLFDGGALAGQILREQDLTFNTRFLDRNLRLYRQDASEDRRNSSVRSNTIRYICAHLTVQDSVNTTRIVEMRSVFRNVLEQLKHDPRDVCDLALKTIETSGLRDSDIPRRLKSSMLSDRSLLGLLDVARSCEPISSKHKATHLDYWACLHRFCTQADLGVLAGSSWYPPSNETSDLNLETSAATSGDAEVSVRNHILSKFVHHLRPHSVLQERELLTDIFRAAPELVADFMRQARSKLSLAPKLTNTWLGYASLMFAIIELPTPTYFGASNAYRSTPPPVEVIAENVLPSPLTAEVLTRCLKQNSTLVRFFAFRLLVIALQKTKTIFDMFTTATKRHPAYAEELPIFTASIMSRLPSFKDIFTAFRATHDSERMAKEAAAHTLALYRTLMPVDQAEDVYDFATPLASSLVALQNESLTVNDRILVELQLTHLLHLARDSPGTRMWQRQGDLGFSPFTTMLHLFANPSTTDLTKARLGSLLKHVTRYTGFLSQSEHALDALLASLEASEEWTAERATWSFLDDCVSRYIKKPIKYGDDLEDLVSDTATTLPQVSVLLLAVLEQAPFLDRQEADDKTQVQTWISRYLQALQDAGEDKSVLKTVKSKLKALFKVEKQQIRAIGPSPIGTDDAAGPDESPRKQHEPAEATDERPTATFLPVPTESGKHPELIRYKKQDVDDLIHDGALSSLMLDLCSTYPEIRHQAMTALLDVQSKILESSLESKDQIWLLVGEIAETARSTIDEHPLSYVAGAFASAALKIVLDPKHFMYGMVARYLIKDPYWNVKKLPGYFVRRTLLEEEPAEDDAYWKQVEWVLTFLIDGVRTSQDCRVLYANNTIEILLELFADAHITTSVAGLIIQLLYRIVAVDSARNLVMNVGLLSWLQEAKRQARSRSKLPRGLIEALIMEVEGLKGDERVKEWRHGMNDAPAGMATPVVA